MNNFSPFNQLFSVKSLHKKLLEPILDSDNGLDAEVLTQLSLSTLKQISLYKSFPIISDLLKQLKNELQISNPKLEQNLFGCHFANPIGLAAGFDKNGIAAGIWDYFGFGFSELGTVTMHCQPGNPKPRLFRLAKEQAALNRLGFNNNGSKEMLNTLKKQDLREKNDRKSLIGINLGKSKITTIDNAPEDYAFSLELLAPLADYAVINVSSPNTPGLRILQEETRLRRLIAKLRRLPECPPLLVKIAPDLDDYGIDAIAKVAFEEGLAGLIAVNTSIDRLGLENRILNQTGNALKNEAGGLSGKPLQQRALSVVKQLYKTTKGELPLIGVGGIDSPKIAWERITAGASLIQIYTGWIYKGPQLVPQILEGLISQLDQYGFNSISEAVGTDAPWKNQK